MYGSAVGRLRRRAEFERVFHLGRNLASRFLVLRWVANGGPDTRVGFAVGRQLGGAVERNRVRRRWREVVRLGPALPSGLDLVVVARGPSREAKWSVLEAAWQDALTRCGWLTPRG